MKFEDNPLWATQCYICGRPCWSQDAHEAWFGTRFFCEHGCNPKDIEAHVLRKIEKRKKETGTNRES